MKRVSTDCCDENSRRRIDSPETQENCDSLFNTDSESDVLATDTFTDNQRSINECDDDLQVCNLALGMGAHTGHMKIDGLITLNATQDDGLLREADIFLRSSACDVNSATNNDTEDGNLPVVEVLLGRGADVNHVTSNGASSYVAAQNDHIPVVEALLRREADVNHVTSNGASSLYIAAQNGYLSVVATLLGHGANMDQATSDKITPLFIAADEGNLPVIEILLSRGANVNQTSRNGNTPLFMAAQNGHLPVVEILLGRGANANIAILKSATPLFISAQEGHLPVVEALLRRGADVNRANRNGATPLYIAAHKGRLPVVEALLGRGADVNLANIQGATPLYMAARNGHLPMIEMLLEQGARIDIRCLRRTPQMISEQRGHFAVTLRLAAVKSVRTREREGHVEHFKEAVKAGVLPAPLRQWMPQLPRAARAALSSWVTAIIADERACFAALFHGPSTAPLRRLSNHQGVVSQALVELLVRRSPGTRLLLRELFMRLHAPQTDILSSPFRVIQGILNSSISLIFADRSAD